MDKYIKNSFARKKTLAILDFAPKEPLFTRKSCFNKIKVSILKPLKIIPYHSLKLATREESRNPT